MTARRVAWAVAIACAFTAGVAAAWRALAEIDDFALTDFTFDTEDHSP